jgi:hypothetical protein
MRSIIRNIKLKISMLLPIVKFRHWSHLDMCECMHESCGSLKTLIHWNYKEWSFSIVREEWSYFLISLTSPMKNHEQHMKNSEEEVKTRTTFICYYDYDERQPDGSWKKNISGSFESTKDLKELMKDLHLVRIEKKNDPSWAIFYNGQIWEYSIDK